MLHNDDAGAIRHIADLALAAREARDRAFLNAAKLELDEPEPPQGRPRPAHRLGLAALPNDEPAARALRDAIDGAPDDLKRKLWVVMRIGSGDYAADEWGQAIDDAALLSHSAFLSELADEAELHTRLMKGLYELRIAEQTNKAL
ncbi:MAG: DUF3775 domain-containing protein [Alphaproteobacteria bacterium]